MGENGERIQEAGSGISRRDALKKTVVAGGLVWATPTLLSSPAGAQTTISCTDCSGGVEATLKIPSNPQAAINCGVSCISHLVEENVPCLKDIGLSCLFGPGKFISVETGSFVNGRDRSAIINVGGGIIPLLIGVKLGSPDCCVVASCEDSYANDTSDCPGVLDPARTVIEVIPHPTLVDAVRILIDANDRPLNHMELAVCIPNALTGQCD